MNGIILMINKQLQQKQNLRENVKTDQSIKISWEDNQSDMIDVSEDIVDIPSDNKD